MTIPYLKLPFEPIPETGSVVSGPQVRFTVLTSRLIRLEHSPGGPFEDRPSQAFWFRKQPAPSFSVSSSPGHIQIETEHLLLRYKVTDRGFTPSTLAIEVKETGQTWDYGDSYWAGGNLYGTARTLDNASGAVALEPGLIGRAGWAVVDDSRSLVFDEEGWLQPRSAPENSDLYFFGYGHDYAGCLRDFSRVAGATPMIPRWVLGNWWSRYWEYSQEELLDLMKEFVAHQAPLSVCIVDMDWHITETGNRCTGWTGYTWNRELFPDPPGFIAELHSLGLKTALNLHPAEGIHAHEEQYPALAERLGMDPVECEPVPFDPTDPQFVQAYFELLHHPFEDQGVDFWWLDWQQGTQTRISGLDPLWWLNHLHFYDLGRDGTKRPLIFSRWGGLGNHRYPIGFSGDTVVGWESLNHQPAFTATAANVGYGWWSHDIGGHMGGVEDDELYVRWVQYGVFSPVLRLHSTKNPFHERRPWGRGPAAEQAASAALRLRHAFIPYLYAMAWRNHTQSLPLVTPMYYSHPEEPEAYACPGQYWFGSELVAAPFTAPAHPETGLARQNVWLPEGDWFNFFTGEYFRGGGWQPVYGGLDNIPVFVRAGAIVPLEPEPGWGGVDNPETLNILIFAGADHRIDLYEDDGETTRYTQGQYAVTSFSQEWDKDGLRFTISPASGDRSVIPASRVYQPAIYGLANPDQVVGELNGKATGIEFEYDEATECLRLAPILIKPTEELVLTVKGGKPVSRRDRTSETLWKFLTAFRLDSRMKHSIERDWPEIVSGELSLNRYPGLKDAHVGVLHSLIERSKRDY